MARVSVASTGRQGREVEGVMMRQGSWEARWVCTVFPWNTGGQSMHLACKVGVGVVFYVSPGRATWDALHREHFC